MLTGDNTRRTKTVLFASKRRRRSPISYAAILGPPSPLLLSSKLIIQLFYLAACHLTQVLRVCLRKKTQPHYSSAAAGNKHAKCRDFNAAHKVGAVAFCPADETLFDCDRARSNICDAECLFVSPDGKTCAGRWEVGAGRHLVWPALWMSRCSAPSPFQDGDASP